MYPSPPSQSFSFQRTGGGAINLFDSCERGMRSLSYESSPVLGDTVSYQSDNNTQLMDIAPPTYVTSEGDSSRVPPVSQGRVERRPTLALNALAIFGLWAYFKKWVAIPSRIMGRGWYRAYLKMLFGGWWLGANLGSTSTGPSSTFRAAPLPIPIPEAAQEADQTSQKPRFYSQ